jgi:hypothetical protein
MRLRGVFATVALAAATVIVSTPAQAATGTTVTPGVATGTGLGFDTCQAPTTAVLRAWTASPYRAVNMYFSGSQRRCSSQPLLTADWVTTVLSNGWSLIPTVVDLQAPCATNSAKSKMSSNLGTAASQGTTAATNAHNDLVNLGLGGTVAYLDLEPFNSANTACARAVLAFSRHWVKRLHALGDKAGVYFNFAQGASTFVNDYSNTYRPDDVWVAEYNKSATAATSVIGTRWPHHRIHQYFSDPGTTTESYAGEALNIDGDAIDGDVVTARSVATPSGPPYAYNVIGTPNGTLNERSQPNTSQPAVTTAAEGDPLSIQCQATGEAVDRDFVWDKLTNGLYVSDLYTSTTGRNWVSSAVAKCDTTPPTLSASPMPSVTVGPSATVRWSAADPADAGQAAGETRGISGTTVRYRSATWKVGFTGWRTLTTTTGSSAALPLSVGYTYCVQVQTRDLSGNASPWSSQSCTTRPLDDRNLAAGSGWSRKSSNKYYKLTFTKTWASGRTLSIANARGRTIGILAATCSSCGVVKVYIGSYFVGRVNLQATGTHYKQLFMLKPFAIRSGTVKLVTKGVRLVQIDGLVISR